MVAISVSSVFFSVPSVVARLRHASNIFLIDSVTSFSVISFAFTFAILIFLQSPTLTCGLLTKLTVKENGEAALKESIPTFGESRGTKFSFLKISERYREIKE